jgi:hypothetical protein
MTRTVALGGLIGGIVLIAIAYITAFLPGGAPGWATWSYMIGTSTSMLAVMVLGAARGRGGIGGLVWPFALIYVVLLAGFGSVLLMPAETGPGGSLWLGLPPRAAIVLYGIGILPLFLLPFAYALTFDSMTLSEEDLARLAAVRREREQHAAAAARKSA